MSLQEIMHYIKESGVVQDLGFGNSIYWDSNRQSWVVTDGDRKLDISEAKAKELVEELVTTF